MAPRNATDNRPAIPHASGPSSGFFQGASNTDASHGTFTDASGNATVINFITNNSQAEESLFKTLVAHVVPGAAYDSSQHEYAPTCLPDTRAGILEKMRDWVDEGDGLPIFWLSGPAGSGKSAIAHTFAKECKDKNILAGSFFFLRGDQFRSGYNNFFITLAYQLAISVPEIRSLMQQALLGDPTIPSQILENQFKLLIYDPILALKNSISSMVVVVDALDECENKDGVLKLISIISHAHHKPPFPLRFLFTSRAYDYIDSKFRDLTTGPLTILSNLWDWKANDDIHRFLRDGFREIYTRRKRVMEGVPEPWPSDSDLDLAVAKSEGVFIWAATVLKFVGSDRGLPQDKLQTALKLHAGLDSLYTQILRDAPLEDPFDCVIGAIPLLRIRLSANQLGQLFRLQANDVVNGLQGLEPILDIADVHKAIQPYHASLHDFLTDVKRSQDFFIDPAKQHFSIMLSCLRIVVNTSQWGIFDKGITDYACRNMFHHFKCALTNEGTNNSLPSQPDGFVANWSMLGTQSFKPWFESLDRRDQLFESRRDLGVTISTLMELPHKPRKLIKMLTTIKQHMLVST